MTSSSSAKRPAAPPYRGEGLHALWHVSEDASIVRFTPHRARTALTDELLVWAVDTRHLPLFWFPRDCPRATFWASETTSDTDVVRFLEGDRARRVHVIETRWLDRVARGRLHLYRMPPDTFAEHDSVAGYWISRETVEPLDRITLDDLVARHERAGIGLRTEASLWPLWAEVTRSTLAYSGLRLRRAGAHA
jgi:hypothetical protein